MRFSPVYSPKQWPVWIGLGLLRGISKLPLSVLLILGRAFGWLLRKVLKSRVRVARKNLELCFPEKTNDEREVMLGKVFDSLGLMLMEMGIAWWGSDRRVRRLAHVSGTEHLDQAMADGQGVILLAAHFTTLDLGGRMVCLHHPENKAGLYRKHGNPTLEHVVKKARLSFVGQVFSREQTRGAIRHMRNGGLLWYAADQDYERGESVFVPFFGIMASTTMSPHQLSRMGRARVLMLSQRRLPGTAGYEIEIQAPLEGFPSDDPEEDCRRVNEAMEANIRKCPEQYLWVHRRFKNRPPGEDSIY